MATITWEGANAPYEIHPIGTDFNPNPGNYVFAKQTTPGSWLPIYAGETSDLSERFDSHHAMPCILENGGTHITVRINQDGEQARRDEERRIRENHNPSCNKQ